MSSGDLGVVAAHFGIIRSNGQLDQTLANLDPDKDGSIGSGDTGWIATQFGSCPLSQRAQTITNVSE